LSSSCVPCVAGFCWCSIFIAPSIFSSVHYI
jgi:hypothetical protein